MSLLNIKHTKAFAKHASEEHRNGKFTRVSKAKLDNWEARLKSMIVSDVKRHRGVGKTLID